MDVTNTLWISKNDDQPEKQLGIVMTWGPQVLRPNLLLAMVSESLGIPAKDLKIDLLEQNVWAVMRDGEAVAHVRNDRRPGYRPEETRGCGHGNFNPAT